ncbi:sensor domain-containing diguanylate cyclase [Clostridium grantii]|uniref:Diguanylate cyclase (GGDEF) domain-containing protein n=1 Tax=Clostridium grantii DSM 8605 TaxID=1121316 RepID=A0A1M5VZV2_9CLOT|nr:diguanylate cyclase [Clostridium grantii]SHH80775.1 diguanylate cyclase (GGDEF) domain-containing protein [Clostridium grantii DSM 8605]
MDSFHQIDTSINILAQRNKIAEKHYGSSKIQGIEILSYVNETIVHSLKINYYQGVCTGYRVLALHYSNIGSEEKALKYLLLCEEYIKNCNLEEINYAHLYNAYVVYYSDLIGDQEKAAYYCKLSIEKSETLDNKVMLMCSKACLGAIHLKLQNHEQGIELTNSTLIYYEAKNDHLSCMYCYNNLGEAYYNLNLIDKSILYYEKAYKLALEEQDIVIIEDSSIGLSRIYSKNGDFTKAIKLLEKTIQIAKDNKVVRVETNAIFELIDIYISKEDLNKAESLLVQSKKLVDEIHNRLVDLHYNERKAKIAEKLENFKEAYYSSLKCQELTKILESENARNISNNLLKTQLNKTRDRLETIFKIGRELTTMNVIDDVLIEVTQKLKKLMDVDFIGIGEIVNDSILFNHCYEEENFLTPVKYSLTDKNSFAVWSIEHQKELMLNDIESEYSLYIKETNIVNSTAMGNITHSLLYAPLIVKNEIIGVFTIQSYKKDAYSSEEFEIFKIIASYIAIAQVNAYQAEKLKNLSLIDTLTNLKNRSGFTSGFDKIVCNNFSIINSVSLIMLDLDHFKLINDNHGHMAGDLVLKKVGKLLSEYENSVDLVARIGGEEFAILIVNKSINFIRTLAEDIRYSFENTKVTYKNKQIKITTSIGVSYISVDKNKLSLFEELYYQADKALYSAKALGRNKVEFFNKKDTSN